MSAAVDTEAPTQQLRVDPRFVERLRSVHLERQRRQWRIVGALAGVVALVAASLGLLHTPLLRVRHVRVVGADGPLTTGSVLAAGGLRRPPLMADIDVAAIAQRIAALPAVATVTVARQWPATVRVRVTARRAVAVVVAGDSRAAVDRTGRVLLLGPAAGAGLPMLTVAAPSVAAGGWIPGAAGAGAAALHATEPGQAAPVFDARHPLMSELAVASAFGPALLGRVATIGVQPGIGLVAGVGGTTFVLGDTTDLLAKVASLAAVVAHGDLASVAIVDLRVPDRPALTPVPGQ